MKVGRAAFVRVCEHACLCITRSDVGEDGKTPMGETYGGNT